MVTIEQQTEMVSLPESGRVFSRPARAGLADVAPSGRVRLDALAGWIQDVSYSDMENAGLAGIAVWVIRKMRIDVTRFPRFGESFELRTFCSGFGRMWAERRVSIVPVDGSEGGVESVTLWVHLDPRTRRPFPLTPPEIVTFREAARGRRVSARLRHRPPEGVLAERPWHFRHGECDLAGHVNNSAYLRPLEEEFLSADLEPERLGLEIEFRSAAQPGEKIILADGPRRWIVGEGETHASILLRD